MPRKTMHLSIFASLRAAFTLAEVLITLGIIGVVAALTIPTLVQNYRNKVVETRLLKVYSAMNNAIALSEVDNGDRTGWYNPGLTGVYPDDDGNLPSTSDQKEWFETYLAPYMRISKITLESSISSERGKLFVYFQDGSVLQSARNTRDWYFFPGDPEKCLEKSPNIGVCRFTFNFCPTCKEIYSSGYWTYAGNGFETWSYNWDGTIEQVENICLGKQTQPDASVNNAVYCSRWIQLNNWKIPDNYPYKVSY